MAANGCDDMERFMKSPVEPFIEISSTQGVTARFLPLGATLTSLFVKDRDSNPVDVVLGFDDVKGWDS
ncbi:hypothetical protein ANCDUO_10091 [Ancylostoma duodenale]|uniref:Galactose mutarotase n=1 Tax=Ancylostoma duodenale TaxID=51022 RepID=A0A0C2DB75_9BILA|nr:hypothetical protein ANCDUO_10091 [Ancylostoma duodenale]